MIIQYKERDIYKPTNISLFILGFYSSFGWYTYPGDGTYDNEICFIGQKET